MTTRDATILAPRYWADLWTSGTEGNRRFYAEAHRWRPPEPDPDRYFNLRQEGAWTAAAAWVG